MMLEVIMGMVARTVPGSQVLLPPESCQKRFPPPTLLYIINPSSDHTPVHKIRDREVGKAGPSIFVVGDRLYFPPEAIRWVSTYRTG